MSAHKRVLLVVHRFWPHPGGSERLFYNVARRLAGRGLEVTMFTTDAWHPESHPSPRKQTLRSGVAGGGPSPGYLTAPQLRLLKAADAIITATAAEGRALEARGLNPSKIHRVGVGIDPSEFAGGEAGRFRERFGLDGPLVLQVSTLSRAKGAADLVEAMKLLWTA